MSDRPTDGSATPGDESHWFYGDQPPTATPPLAPPPDGAEPGKPGRSKVAWIAAAVAAVIIVGAGAFALTSKSSSGSNSTVAAAQAGGNGAGTGGYGFGDRAGRRGGRGTRGTITAIDGSTLTLSVTQFDPGQLGQNSQGGQGGSQASPTTTTTKVVTTDKTTFTEQVEGSVSDLAKGDTVLVTSGDSSSSGSTATTVTAARIIDQGDDPSLAGGFLGAGQTPPNASGGAVPGTGQGAPPMVARGTGRAPAARASVVVASVASRPARSRRSTARPSR